MFPRFSINSYYCQVAIIVFGLVSGGGVTGRSSEEQTAVTPADLTGGEICVLCHNFLSTFFIT